MQEYVNNREPLLFFYDHITSTGRADLWKQFDVTEEEQIAGVFSIDEITETKTSLHPSYQNGSTRTLYRALFRRFSFEKIYQREKQLSEQ